MGKFDNKNYVILRLDFDDKNPSFDILSVYDFGGYDDLEGGDTLYSSKIDYYIIPKDSVNDLKEVKNIYNNLVGAEELDWDGPTQKIGTGDPEYDQYLIDDMWDKEYESLLMELDKVLKKYELSLKECKISSIEDQKRLLSEIFGEDYYDEDLSLLSEEEWDDLPNYMRAINTALNKGIDHVRTTFMNYIKKDKRLFTKLLPYINKKLKDRSDYDQIKDQLTKILQEVESEVKMNKNFNRIDRVLNKYKGN